MNSLIRPLAIVLFSLGLLGASGCSQDNETEAQKLSKNMGDPGPGEIKNKVEAPKLSNDPVERFKQRGNARPGPGYPTGPQR